MAEFKVPILPVNSKLLIGPRLPSQLEEVVHEPVTSSASDEATLITKNGENSTEVLPTTIDNQNPDPQQTTERATTGRNKEEHEDLKLAYSEPQWSGKPQPELYQLLVIKNGVEINTIDLSNKSFCVCGRLPSCDIHLEHPSISRHHAVLQFRPESDRTPQNESATFSNIPREAGFYLYDLSSTHGTYLTKKKLQPRCYYRMRVGQSVKFGGSSRLFVLDQKSESGQEVVEAEAEEERAEITRKTKEYEEYLRRAEEEEQRKIKEQEDMGATWGILMDDIATDQEQNDMPIDEEKEAYYINDPKKALKTFFDREGMELEYETSDTGPNHSKTYTVKVWLPIYTSTGESVYAEASVKGNKKQAVLECALEACRLLDAENILRQSGHSSHKHRQKELEDNDYYDSDEDNFLDRTGDVERKRKRRMIRAGKINESVETYQSLADKLSVVQNELLDLRNKLEKHKQCKDSIGGDSLEDYMRVVSGQLDSATISRFKVKISQLQKEEKKLLKLVNVAKPYQLPGSSHAPVSPVPMDSSNTVLVGQQAQHKSDSDSVLGHQNEHESDERAQKKAIEEKVTSLLEDVGSHSIKSNYGLILPSDLDKCEPKPPPCKKKRKVMGPTLPRSVKKQMQESSKMLNVDNDFDPEFASWIPPEDQTGDGRTRLNEKLGY